MRRHVQDITQNHPKTDDGNIRSRKLGRPDTVSDKERRPRGDGGAVCAAYVYAVRLTSQCFTGDTLVLMEYGLTPIADIEAGDYVWSEDTETGECVLREVMGVSHCRRHRLQRMDKPVCKVQMQLMLRLCSISQGAFGEQN